MPWQRASPGTTVKKSAVQARAVNIRFIFFLSKSLSGLSRFGSSRRGAAAKLLGSHLLFLFELIHYNGGALTLFLRHWTRLGMTAIEHLPGFVGLRSPARHVRIPPVGGMRGD